MTKSDKTNAMIMISIVLLSLYPVAGYLAIAILLSRFIRHSKFGSLIEVAKNDRGLLFLMAAFSLSAIFTKQHTASLAGMTVFGLQLALFVIIRSAAKEQVDNYNIIKYLLLTSLIVSSFGIFQYYFGAQMYPDWVDKNLYGNIFNRAFSTLYNPNVLGSYLIMIISLVMAGFRFNTSRYSKAFNYLVLTTASLCMVLTFSRGAWFGVAASVLVILAFSPRRPYVLAVIAVALVLAIPEYKTILNRISLDFLANDSSKMYRVYLWKYAIRTFQERPLVGSGLGSFGFFIPSHFKAAGYLVSHAHNIYLQLLAETGILGFTAFIGYYTATLYKCFKVYRHSLYSQTKNLALGVLAAGTGLLVHGIVDATLWLPQMSVFVWILFAVIRNIDDMEPQSVTPPVSGFSGPGKPC